MDGEAIESIGPEDESGDTPLQSFNAHAPSRHFPGRRVHMGGNRDTDAEKPSATHGRYPGHRHAVKRWERETGAGRMHVGKLADIRKKHMEELEKDPKTKQELWDIVDAEVGEEGVKTKTMMIESVFNRAASRGHTIKQTIHDGYYARKSMAKVGRGGGRAENEALANVAGGSNLSKYSTGNSSGNVMFNRGPQRVESEGERFGTEGPDVGWANRMRQFEGGDDALPGGQGGAGTKIPGRMANTSNLNETFKKRLDAMYDAAPSDIKAGLGIKSGWRSYEHQARLFAQSDRSGHMVARPGHSMHEHGLAADLAFGNERARQWVHEHAAEHGLKFPMPYEPWHIEPQETRGGQRFHDIPPKSGAERAQDWESHLNKGLPMAATAPHAFPRGPFGREETQEEALDAVRKAGYGVGSRWGFDPNVQWALGKNPVQRHYEKDFWTNRALPEHRNAGKVEIPNYPYEGDPDINKDPGGVPYDFYTEGRTFRPPEERGYTEKEGQGLRAPWATNPTPQVPGTPLPRPNPFRRRFLKGPEDR